MEVVTQRDSHDCPIKNVTIGSQASVTLDPCLEHEGLYEK